MSKKKSSDELEQAVTEAELQAQVEDLLTLRGWLWFHDRATNHAHMNNPGFPDICAVHPPTGSVLFLELKSEKGRLSKTQKAWQQALSLHSENRSHYYMLVRPSLFDVLLDVVSRLSGGDPRTRHQSDQSDAEREESDLGN